MAHRKLQAEIDRVLKKVDEGVGQFEETWEKVKDASTPNLKEKYEGDLKKEIKKLQRYRDQIKTWAGSNEVKKKQPLIDARKLIETKMEKFKILEKETKTKAYSKEGLSKSLKKKKDPTKDPKYKSYVWIDETREALKEQISEVESTLDDLKAGGKKKLKENQSAIEECVLRIERHTWHVEKLTEMYQRLQSSDITLNKVEEMKDNVQYYVDSNQDPDFYEDECVYDTMDEPDVIIDEPPKDVSESPGLPIPVAADDEEDTGIEVHVPVLQVSANYAPAPKVVEVKEPVEEEKPTPPSPSVSASASSNTSKPFTAPAASETFANLIRRNSAHERAGNSPALSAAQVVAQQSASPALSSPPQGQGSVYSSTNNSPLILAQSAAAPSPRQAHQQAGSGTQQMEYATMSRSAQQQQQQQQQQQHSLQRSVSQPQLAARSGVFGGATPMEMNPFATLPSSSAYQTNMQQMLTSTRYFPQPMDTERADPYTPRNPFATPRCFPSVPLQEFDDPAMFAKFDTDTLFFVFYFQQGTPQQYLAATELRKQSWRYHKNFLTWFQRHEDPTHATDEYEAGTYVYFDYESGWCSRIKKDFTFHYQHLEDELPTP